MNAQGRASPDIPKRPTISAGEAQSTAQSGLYPGLPAFVRADGCWLYDAAGNPYFDATSGSGALNLGHNHPQVIAAAVEQTRRIVHTGSFFHSDARDRFVERVCGFAPFDECAALLTVTGTEAVEAALKAARAYTGRRAVAAFTYAYHGKSSGGLSVTWRDSYKRYSPLPPNVVWASPYPLLHATEEVHSSAACLDAFEDTLERMVAAGHPPAAVILEPVIATEGILPAGRAFLEGLMIRARRAGALVIFDELWTAIGRCGTPFYAGRPGLDPDMVLVGKSVANGFPLSAVLGAPAILNALPSGLHTATFAGHPVGCAAATAVLDVMEALQPWGAALERGAHLFAVLQELETQHAFIGGARGEGLLLGFDCVDHAGRASPDIARDFAMRAQQKGLLLAFGGREGNTIKVTPPLTLQEEEQRFLTDALRDIASGMA